jgi:hypothetical protein
MYENGTMRSVETIRRGRGDKQKDGRGEFN